MQEFAPGAARVPILFVNAYFIGQPGGPWALVDTGVPGFAGKIRAASESRFGKDARPECILLTHGHFDHSGNARALAEHWDVPIYAHRLELPYLTGRSAYPPPDPTIGGCIAMLSRAMPYGAMDLGPRLHPLTGDANGGSGPIAGLPGWRWLHTPGHSPGHAAFFQEDERILLAGDALATMDMDSYVGMLTERQKLAPAGSPFICDWTQAADSAEQLAALKLLALGCGHGVPMRGDRLPIELQDFADVFAPPAYGRYVIQPALTDARGVDWLPPRRRDPLPTMALALAAGALGFMAARRRRR